MPTVKEKAEQLAIDFDAGNFISGKGNASFVRELLRRLDVAIEALTWLCVREVHYDTDVRQAPNLTEDAWRKADEALEQLSAEWKP